VVREPSDGNEVEQALRVVRERFPEKDRFPPPREQGVATFLTPPPREEEALDFGDRVARVPDPPAAVAEERPAAEFLGRLAPPLEEVPSELPDAEQPPELAESEPDPGLPPAIEPEDETPAEVPDDAVVTLEPAEARPPEKPAEAPEEPEEPEEPAAVAAEQPVEEPAPEELPLVGSLDANRYYLQVGAYSNAGSARQAVEQLGAQYPTEVLADGGNGRRLYRVLVGPLNEDERGSVLYFVRAMGYRDAFIRQADG
jgi:cell division protein FtsN